MAITTWAEVQLILGLSAAQQTLVDGLIQHIEEDYLRIRNKPFDVGSVITVTGAATTTGNITITISDTDFPVPVVAGDNTLTVARKIAFHLRQYFDASHRDSTATVYGFFVVTFDGGTTGVTATVAGPDTIYPTGAEYTAIKMIQFHLTAGVAVGAQGISSESLGDYSITYSTGLGSRTSDYPKDVVGGIKQYVGFT